MKVGFIADCHIGNHRRFGGPMINSVNTRCQLTLDVFAIACERAGAQCDVLVIAGDLFDYARPEAPLVRCVQEILATRAPETFVIPGNHDRVSANTRDHALGPLSEVRNLHIVETPCVIDIGVQTAFIPHVPNAKRGWLPNTLRGLLGVQEEPGRRDTPPTLRPRLLVFHAGLIDKATPPWLASSESAVPASEVLDLLDTYDITCALAGDWHTRKTWRRGPRRAMQIGALCPTGWDNPGLTGYGTLAVFDSATGTLTHEELVGPRFVKVLSTVDAAGALEHAGKNTLFASINVLPDAFAEATDWLATNGLLGEVTLDEVEAQNEAKVAANAAKNATNFEQALVEYVERMPLDEDVDRAAVLLLARGFTGGSAV